MRGMSERPSISLCMIVKDEGKFLKKCLESVGPIVSEIIIVDTGSKDNTQAIALALGAKLFMYRWDDDFSAARNLSISKATKEWILVLDADETIAAQDLLKLAKLTNGSDAYAYSFIQRNYFKDKAPTTFEVTSKGDGYAESSPYSGWFPSELVRLFRNKKNYQFSGLVHELVEPSINEKEGKIKQSEIPIHHFRVEKSVGNELEKREKYLQIGLKQIELTPENPKAFFEVGELYAMKGDHLKAIDMLGKSAQLIEAMNRPKEYASTWCYVYFNLGKEFYEINDYERAKFFFQKLVLVYPTFMVYFFLGLCNARLDLPEEAIPAYQKALELKPDDGEIHNNLANMYIAAEKFEEAVAQFNIALKYLPNNAIIYRNMGAALLELGQLDEGLAAFKKSISLEPKFEAELKDGLEAIENAIANRKRDSWQG